MTPAADASDSAGAETAAADSGHYVSLVELGERGINPLELGTGPQELNSSQPEPAIGPLATSSVITAGSCKYQQRVDDAHISKSEFAASTHGWWTKYSGTCPSYANLDIYLQAVYCDSYGCYWKTVKKVSKDVKAYNLSGGKRVNARRACSRSTTVGYRSFVDVDLKSWSDPSGYTYSTPKDLGCYPF